VSSADLALIRRIDEQHPQCPFAGARMLSIMMLTREGRTVGLTLMKRIGLHALYRKPNPANGNWRVRCTRICCAIWRSLNQTMSRRLANRLTTNFCIEAVREALASYGTPDIFNIDQGC
jgi:putative transposase